MEPSNVHVFSVTIRHVKSIETVAFQVTDLKDDTVQDLKQHIYAKTGIKPANQRLVFGGQSLSNKKTLRDIGIGDGSTVHMLERLPEHVTNTVNVFGKGLDGRTVSVEINYNTAIAYDLKVGIANEYDCAVCDVRIIFCGRILQDNESLQGIELLKHACFHFVFH